MTRPAGSQLDPVLHNATRLTVLAYLSACKEAEFGVVREHCAVSDPTLSKAVGQLETAKYVKVKKGYVGKYPRTWLAATAAGRTALKAHLKALEDLVAGAQRAGALNV
jgi:DNA-binding MarR family transcriptional regulator